MCFWGKVLLIKLAQVLAMSAATTLATVTSKKENRNLDRFKDKPEDLQKQLLLKAEAKRLRKQKSKI